MFTKFEAGAAMAITLNLFLAANLVSGSNMWPAARPALAAPGTPMQGKLQEACECPSPVIQDGRNQGS